MVLSGLGKTILGGDFGTDDAMASRRIDYLLFKTINERRYDMASLTASIEHWPPIFVKVSALAGSFIETERKRNVLNHKK